MAEPEADEALHVADNSTRVLRKTGIRSREFRPREDP